MQLVIYLSRIYILLLHFVLVGTYAKEIEEDVRIRDSMSNVQSALLEAEQQCAAFQQQFSKYAYLWQTDMQQALGNFLTLQGRQQEGPSLASFAAEIATYKAIQEEVQALPSGAAFGWIKVDARPLKQAMLMWTSKWIYLFVHHLLTKVCWQ